MSDSPYLANQFLIAMPGLEDPNFFHSVTYICEHNEEGALGLVINRPLQMQLGEILQHIKLERIEPQAKQLPVHLGGPVQQDRGFVLHEPLGDWDATLKVTERHKPRPRTQPHCPRLRRLGSRPTGTGNGRECLVERPR
jgi:putative transcriptional regulator